jgi:hypothetical protein
MAQKVRAFILFFGRSRAPKLTLLGMVLISDMETLLAYVRLIVNPADDSAAHMAIAQLKYGTKKANLGGRAVRQKT